MLQDVDKTLENILRERGKIPKSDIDVSFDQPTGEWSAGVSRPTINIYCFDVRENLKLRRPDYNVQKNGRGARYTRPPSRIDLSYLVTSWARKTEDQHALLWRSLHTLKSVQAIRPEDAHGQVRDQQHEIPVWVADMSIIGQRYNITDIWSVMDNQMKLGFLLVLTVDLMLDIEFESPLVLEGRLRVQQMEAERTDREPSPKPGVVTERQAPTAPAEDGQTPDIDIVHRAGDADDEDDG